MDFEQSHLFFVGVDAAPLAVRAMPRPRRRFQNSSRLPLPLLTEQRSSTWLDGLLRRANLNPLSYRSEALQRRLPACLRWLKARSTDHADILLRARPELLPGVLSTLLLGVTSFFRDRDVFKFLEQSVIPDLFAPGTARRAWCAACSDGAEAYSLAMILDRCGLADVRITASDCRADAIERARRGTYARAVLEDFSHAHIERHFTCEEETWQASDALRQRIEWRVANLLEYIEAGTWRLIFWRNMAIYLKPEAAAGLWHKLAQALEPGGVLVVGKAERPPQGLDLKRLGTCVYLKKDADHG